MYSSLLLNLIILIVAILFIVALFSQNKNSCLESFFSDSSSSSDNTFSSQNLSSSSFLKDYLGPNYSYIKKIKTPNKLHVTQKSDLFAIPPNIKGTEHYIKTLVSGNPPLGDSFFVKSGTCDKKTSVPECQGQDRYIYINNFSTGLVPCTNYTSSNKGLIPGLLEDATYLNPYEIFKNMSGLSPSYTTNCSLRTEKVGSKKSSRKNETRCSVPSPVPECLPSF